MARLTPIWEHRRKLDQQPTLVDEVIATGTQRAGVVARQTIEEVTDAMNI